MKTLLDINCEKIQLTSIFFKIHKKLCTKMLAGLCQSTFMSKIVNLWKFFRQKLLRLDPCTGEQIVSKIKSCIYTWWLRPDIFEWGFNRKLRTSGRFSSLLWASVLAKEIRRPQCPKTQTKVFKISFPWNYQSDVLHECLNREPFL